jgi:hypothetical protein
MKNADHEPDRVSPPKPYSNSVACRTLIDIGSRRTFHRPNAKNINAPTANSDRMIGVPIKVAKPSRRLATTTETDASSSGLGIG